MKFSIIRLWEELFLWPPIGAIEANMPDFDICWNSMKIQAMLVNTEVVSEDENIVVV